MLKKLTFAIILLSGCAAPEHLPSAADICEITVRDYAVLRDDPKSASAYGDLFTLDGEFHLGGNVVKGRDALIARHVASNESLRWRHNTTDIRIFEDEGQITGTTRFHIFAGPISENPVPHNREILGDYEDEFVLENGKCKLKSRKVKVTFDKKT